TLHLILHDRRMRSRGLLAIHALFWILAATNARATDTTWIYNGSGAWNEPAKWSNGEPVDVSYNAVIDDGDSAASVNLYSSRAIGSLQIGSNDWLTVDAITSASV